MKYFILVCIAIAVVLACKAYKKKIPEDAVLDDLAEFPNALYPVTVKGRWGYINNKLKIAIEPTFAKAEDFSEGFAVVTTHSGVSNDTEAIKEKQGYIDSTGKIVIACEYDEAFAFSEGLAAVGKNGKFGFIDNQGNQQVPFLYEEVSQFFDGLAAVKLNGKNGFIDTSGKMVIPPQFERACWVSDFSEGLSAVYTSDEGGGRYINKKGEFVVPGTYNYVGAFSEGLALVQPAGESKYGYINMKGELVIKPQYDLSLPFCEGLATVKYTKPDGNTVFRIIDKNENVIGRDLDFAFVGIFREGMAGVETYDNRWGFVDKTGKLVIEPKYASVKLFKNGLSRVETGSLFKGLHVSYMNKSGKIVWKE